MLCPDGKLDEYGHIIPKFVMRWLRRASKKENFYFNNSAKNKVADTVAIRFLCPECEDKFSAIEKNFTDHYFKRHYRNQSTSAPDDKVYGFALSVAWRLIGSQTLMKESAAVDGTFKSILLRASNFFLSPHIDSELSVYVLHAGEIEANMPASAISRSDLRYSIKHGLMAHEIFDASTRFRMTIGKIPLVYFKLGVYYFVVTLAGYFDHTLFLVQSIRTGIQHRIYQVKYSADFLGFLRWVSKGDISETGISLSDLQRYDLRAVIRRA